MAIKKVKRLGRYLILERIGIGGTAEIFKGVTFDHHNSSVFVAIKKILPHLKDDKEFIEMFLYEAKLISMLNHPNIIVIYEFTKIKDEYILVLEYIPGKDLKRIIERCKKFGIKFNYESAAYIIAEALAGLDYAHRLVDSEGKFIKLVHRDFSPSNILIGYDGIVKLCDFGIAKSTLSTITTRAGIVKGKVKYMSPEQAYGKKLDHRSDIYSAGIILYELVTGITPFSGENDLEIIHKVREGKYIPPRRLNPNIPQELEEIIVKAMSKSKAARFSSAQEFRNELLRFLEKRGGAERQFELSLFMRKLWLEELEREYKKYEYIVVEDEELTQTDWGDNLIKDVLGENAPYTNFKPFKEKQNLPESIIKNGEMFTSTRTLKPIEECDLSDMDSKWYELKNETLDYEEQLKLTHDAKTRIIFINNQPEIVQVSQMETKILDTKKLDTHEDIINVASQQTKIINIEEEDSSIS